MKRDQLRLLLRAGPSRLFDVRLSSRLLAASGQRGDLLFSAGFLNTALFLKTYDPTRPRRIDDHKIVDTLVFLPFDNTRPADGGESFIFCEETFLTLLEYKLSSFSNGSDVAGDLAKLRVLDALPTFSPFILELAFQRHQIAIPPAYLQLTPELRLNLTEHLKGRVRPLIIAAYGPSGSSIDRAVENLTNKLFYLHDIAELLPLAEALRLQPASAQEVLTAWVGIAYFEYEYSRLQPLLTEFACWLGNYDPSGDAPRDEIQHVKAQMAGIRQKVRDDWNGVVGISGDYRSSYHSMVFSSKPEPFIRFLADARRHYWRMGDVLGRLEQAMRIWQHFTDSAPRRQVAYMRMQEMLSALRLTLTSATPVAPAACAS